MNKPNLIKAESAANQVLIEYEITEAPVDPLLIASKKGIIVEAAPLENCFGQFYKLGDKFIILYSNAIDNDRFKRFTVAHELGHYCLAGHPEYLLENSTHHQSKGEHLSHDPYEREADEFAANLLMPKNLFKAQIKKQKTEGMSAIKSLSNSFETSLISTALRYVKLTDIPAAIILSENNKVCWFSASKAFKDIPNLSWPQKGHAIPRESATYDASPQSKEGKASMSTQDWCGGSKDIEIQEEYIDLGSYGKVLTILTAEDYDPEDGMEEDDSPW
ncbi:MAG: ImmA/IrrE family metallo-endopeptidase [Gammaproteobacteria bacterium]|nr:ImmA/IrrE family metallo-endopeptidase [Gammaproteobacteria bacterium]